MRSPLISADELAAILHDGDVRVIDASWRLDGTDMAAAHRQARIPGAVFFDLEAISDHDSQLPHMLPSPDAFASAAGELGVSEADRIVVYDADGMAPAARVWWTFRIMGARDVRVLEGGLPVWLRAGGDIESGPPETPAPAVFRPDFDPSLVVDMAAVRTALNDPDTRILDARPTFRFRGEAPEPRPGLKSGHMPGARSIPFTRLLTLGGAAMLAREELAAIFDSLELRDGQRIITTCGSGVTAAVVSLALAVLGRSSAVYDGSWAEWGGRDDTPVVTGQ